MRVYNLRADCRRANILGHFKFPLSGSPRLVAFSLTVSSPFAVPHLSQCQVTNGPARVGVVVVGVDIICQEITQLASQLCGPTDLTN